MRQFIAYVALLIIARVRGQADNCRDVQSQSQCTQTISDINALYCQFNANGNVCFTGSDCKVCEKAQSGVCVPSCVGAVGSGCAESACPDAGCNRFLSGWSGNSCMRYASGGFCMAGVGGSCLNASDVVAMSASARAAACSARPSVADATCGSSGCARFGSSTCNPDIETSVGSVFTYCVTNSTAANCPASQTCDIKGFCVPQSICDDVDRISDCSLVTHPGTNQSCNVGIAGCTTPLDAQMSIVAPDQSGCGAHTTLSACESGTCTRNGLGCIWVDFRTGTATAGMCVCHPDCPPCSTRNGTVCRFNNPYSSYGVVEPASCTGSSHSSVFVPSRGNEIIFGFTNLSAAYLSCAYRLGREPVSCPTGTRCDSGTSGKCAADTLCDVATTAADCGMYFCDWDRSPCLWTGSVCRCNKVAPTNVTAPVPQGLPPAVYVHSVRISQVGCTSVFDCPAIYRGMSAFSGYDGNSFVGMGNLDSASPLPRTLSASSSSDRPTLYFRFSSPSPVIMGIAVSSRLAAYPTANFAHCNVTIWAVVKDTAIQVFAPSSTTGTIPATDWSVFETRPVFGALALFVQFTFVRPASGTPSNCLVSDVLLFGWTQDAAMRNSSLTVPTLGTVYHRISGPLPDLPRPPPNQTPPPATTTRTTTTPRPPTPPPTPVPPTPFASQPTPSPTPRPPTPVPQNPTTSTTTTQSTTPNPTSLQSDPAPHPPTPSSTTAVGTGSPALSTTPGTLTMTPTTASAIIATIVSDTNSPNSTAIQAATDVATNIALVAGIAGGVGGVLLLAIVAAVAAVLIYRNKLADSNLRNSQLQHSMRTMSIRNMPMQDHDGSNRGSGSFRSMYDHVPMVEREAAYAGPSTIRGNYANPHVFATSDTVFTQLHASEVASSKGSIAAPQTN